MDLPFFAHFLAEGVRFLSNARPAPQFAERNANAFDSAGANRETGIAASFECALVGAPGKLACDAATLVARTRSVRITLRWIDGLTALNTVSKF